MAVTQISRIFTRRGPRSELPQQLAEGEIGFAVDTGEIFIGAPNLASTAYTTPVPLNRNDSNIRILTELDSVSQVDQFVTVALPIGGEPTFVCSFTTDPDFAIVDYGITDSTGAISSSTLWIAMGSTNNIINDNSFASNDLVFSLSRLNYHLSLYATNSTSSQLTISYHVRSWKSITTSSVISRASLKPISGSILVNQNT